jgi:hypothetical protein
MVLHEITLVMGHEMVFIMQGGAHERYFMGKKIGYGKKIAIVEDQKEERSVVVTTNGRNSY